MVWEINFSKITETTSYNDQAPIEERSNDRVGKIVIQKLFVHSYSRVRMIHAKEHNNNFNSYFISSFFTVVTVCQNRSNS